MNELHENENRKIKLMTKTLVRLNFFSKQQQQQQRQQQQQQQQQQFMGKCYRLAFQVEILTTLFSVFRDKDNLFENRFDNFWGAVSSFWR